MSYRLIVLIAALSSCEGIGYDLNSAKLANLADVGMADSSVDAALDLGDERDLNGPRDIGTPDADPGDAADFDARDVDSDMPDVFVSVCEIPHPVDATRCNPTETGACPLEGFCSLAVASAPPPELLCVQRSSEGSSVVGDPCERAFDCLEGTTCVDWTLEADPRPKSCARYCEIETNKGCLAGEFCSAAASQPPLDGIGWCVPECDPYDLDACPTGQTCNVDYNFPAGSCTPHFRCVSVEDFVPEGGSCGAGRAIASCAEDLICYEIDVADFRCVTACQSDADCTSGTCQAAAGVWGLRYCQ